MVLLTREEQCRLGRCILFLHPSSIAAPPRRHVDVGTIGGELVRSRACGKLPE
jgi:hypothetical protein